MHLALRLPDIVDNILEHLDSQDIRRAGLVCRDWYDLKLPSMHRQKFFGDLVAKLPEDLIVAEDLAALQAYSGMTPRPDILPFGTTAVLPRFFKIANLERTSAPEPRDDGTAPETPPDPLNFMNFPPSFVEAVIPPANALDRLIVWSAQPYQFVKILERAPTEDELAAFLRESTVCTRLTYHMEDAKAFLAIHTLERLFPRIDFFPRLSDIVIVGSGSNDRSYPSETAEVRIPFSLIRRASLIVFDDVLVGHLWSSGIQPILRDMAHLPLNAFAPLTEVRHVVRWASTGGDAPHETLPTNMNKSLPTQSWALERMKVQSRLRMMTLPCVPSSWHASACGDIKELILGQEPDLPLPSPDNPRSSEPNLPPPPPCHLERLTARGHTICRRLVRLLGRTDLPDLTHLVIEAPKVTIDPALTLKFLTHIGGKMTGLRHLHFDLTPVTPSSVDLKGIPMRHTEVGMEKLDLLKVLGNLSQLEHLHIMLPPPKPSPFSTPPVRAGEEPPSSNPLHTSSVPDNTSLTGVRLIPLSVPDVLHTIPKTWPNLTHLMLDPLGFPRSTNLLAFETLVKLGQIMPKLEVLGLGLDMRPGAVHVVYSSDMYKIDSPADARLELPVIPTHHGRQAASARAAPAVVRQNAVQATAVVMHHSESLDSDADDDGETTQFDSSEDEDALPVPPAPNPLPTPPAEPAPASAPAPPTDLTPPTIPALRQLAFGLPIFQDSPAAVDTLCTLFPHLARLIVPYVPPSPPHWEPAPPAPPAPGPVLPVFGPPERPAWWTTYKPRDTPHREDVVIVEEPVEPEPEPEPAVETGMGMDPDEGRARQLKRMDELILARVYVPPRFEGDRIVGSGGGWSGTMRMGQNSEFVVSGGEKALVEGLRAWDASRQKDVSDREALMAPAVGGWMEEEDDSYFYDSQEDEGEEETEEEEESE